ncbi:MAG: hypothetical protein WBH57_08415, partial [Anaerolineae bacterium]
GMGANNHYPMSGHQAKEAVVPNTISGALKLGRAVLRAREESGDPVTAAIGLLGGDRLFAGTLTSLREEEKMGFYYTIASLEGREEFRGRSARLVIKNETMLLSIDEEIKVFFPDLVCMLEPATGRGVMSVDLEVGTSLVLVGARCHQRLREAAQSEIGGVAFSPARYGYPELKYQPIETLVEGFR